MRLASPRTAGFVTLMESRRQLRKGSLSNRLDRIEVGAIDLTISIPAQGFDHRDGLTIVNLPVTLFLRARRFNVAVNFKGLRRTSSMPFSV
jgi:hypothetical protein